MALAVGTTGALAGCLAGVANTDGAPSGGATADRRWYVTPGRGGH